MHIKDIRVVLIGDDNIGKTELTSQLSNRAPFNPKYIPTIGVELAYVEMEDAENITRIRFRDTSGQERYEVYAYNYNKDTQIVFLCVEPYTCIQSSFDKLSNIISQSMPQDALLVLIETKSDLDTDPDKDRSFFDSKVQEFTEKHSIKYHYKTSAKSGAGIDDINSFFVTYIKETQNSQAVTSSSTQHEYHSIIDDIGMDEGIKYSFAFKALTAIAAVVGASLLVAAIVLLTVTTFGIAGIVLAAVGGGLMLAASSAAGVGFFKSNYCSKVEEEIGETQSQPVYW